MTADGQLDDRELMRRHADGDPEAFATLVARHRDRLWAVALRTLRQPEDAADALQDALLSAYRAASSASYRGEASPTTWLHRIVVNACLDRARRAAVRPTSPLPDEVAAALPDPGDRMAATDLSLTVNAALATLPVEQRAALVLVDMQGYSVEEAAEMLGCAAGTVKSRCARGRAKLLPLLRDLRDGERNRGSAPDVPLTGASAPQPVQQPALQRAQQPPPHRSATTPSLTTTPTEGSTT
ncbi:MAG: RNA polymerase sigma factor SigM [Actinomycetales bacterium]